MYSYTAAYTWEAKANSHHSLYNDFNFTAVWEVTTIQCAVRTAISSTVYTIAVEEDAAATVLIKKWDLNASSNLLTAHALLYFAILVLDSSLKLFAVVYDFRKLSFKHLKSQRPFFFRFSRPSIASFWFMPSRPSRSTESASLSLSKRLSYQTCPLLCNHKGAKNVLSTGKQDFKCDVNTFLSVLSNALRRDSLRLSPHLFFSNWRKSIVSFWSFLSVLFFLIVG